ncbi:MAG: RnfABCDGE type electron transport complex subunit D [SAR324 cluster bacterium]|nr:RnfABCDGE type electron transport complex subunit D [SAR324 cluster bacterium]
MSKLRYIPTLSTSPFLHDRTSTQKIMWEVVYTLIPLVFASMYFFGLGALLVILASVMGSLLTEFVLNKRKSVRQIADGSAMITGILLGLCLPPAFPLWMAFLGGVISIAMGKTIWGGLGNNVFNPALVGRAFLQAAFPSAITTWTTPVNGSNWLQTYTSNFAPPFLKSQEPDMISGATSLSKMKFEHSFTNTSDLFLGNVNGSLGETASFLILILGIYLIWRKLMTWRIPLSILATVILFSGIFYMLDPGSYPPPLFMIFSGGLMLGTFYMATDLVTSPVTPKGQWIFGIGIGILVVLIRYWGGLPEGVMYAILLMNAATPLINKATKIKPYGRR